MKVSELIEDLEEIKKASGDLEVVFWYADSETSTPAIDVCRHGDRGVALYIDGAPE